MGDMLRGGVRHSLPVAALLALLAVGLWSGARAQAAGLLEEVEEGPSANLSLPPGARLLRDVAYGGDPKQRLDVYEPAPEATPKSAGGAPILVMVHGGGWRWGDKAAARVVENKAKHWLPKGFLFISVNNRLRPEADPLQQADDVATALTFIQHQAMAWGGDPAKIILMGHSAGGHLVALLAADPTRAAEAGAQPWRATVALDSGALDVAAIMTQRHFRLYDVAFGTDPTLWHASSPIEHITASATPMLLVCSTTRQTSCPEAQRFAAAAEAKGVRARVLPEALSHGDINATLGQPGAYTEAVDAFIDDVLTKP